MYLPSFPTIANAFGTSASNVQLSLTFCLLGLAAGQIVFGPLSDKRGRKMPLISALILYVFASVLCIFAPSIWLFIAARFFEGLTASAGVVISRAIVRDIYSGKDLTKLYGLITLFVGVGPILAPIFGGAVLNFTNWQGIFLLLGFLTLAILAFIFIVLPEINPASNRVDGNIKETLITFGKLTKNKRFLGYGLTQGLIMAGVFANVSGTPFIYQSIYGVSPQMFSFLFALNGAGIILGTRIIGRITKKIEEDKLLYIGLCISTLFSIILFFMTWIQAPLPLTVIPLFLVVFCTGISTPLTFSLAMRNQKKHAGSASAFLGILPYLLGGIAIPFVGISGESTAVPMGVTMVIANLGGLLSYLLFVRKNPL
ncbi:Bicyclomycin resistance protein [Oceanobacillus oncorhynchi]|uniref:Bcr/CflA family efflux transporter n=1 Tax=Oceanobacillus oncorhynchi TaxID=545501 RepID=A0A0A1MSS1_9BACI|nr:multidrug effflux MFS transporter [Oceanobacillus oncorhynchi]CEI82714.1 Bicyclomycin resistance protein [Oceanobacillus oncorhynchi]